MKIEINNISKDVLEAKNAALKAIEMYRPSEGNTTPIIILKTDKGNFSNFKTVFDKQDIDVESLQVGDILDITYTTYEARNGVCFKNFKKVTKAAI